jgi:hypothetical protein
LWYKAPAQTKNTIPHLIFQILSAEIKRMHNTKISRRVHLEIKV